jgi:hypothetical protein
MLCNLRHVLHRGNPIRWNSDFAAGICFASRLLALVPSAVRSGLRCMGELYAAGVFADFITVTVRACDVRAFIESTARTAATTVHLSAAVEIPTN